MARLKDDGKELKFIGIKDLAEHYAAVRKRLDGRAKLIESLKPKSGVVVAHFLQPMTFYFTNQPNQDEIEEEDLKPKVTIYQILITVCRYFELPVNEVISIRRHGHLVRARHIGMYLSHELTPCSYPQIARKFGNRDHTTVLHGIHKVQQELSTQSTGLRETLDSIKAML